MTELRFALFGTARPPFGVRRDPRLDRGARPHPSGRQIDLRLREVLVGLDQLRDALAGDAEDLRDLRHADEMMHTSTINHPLRTVKVSILTSS